MGGSAEAMLTHLRNNFGRSAAKVQIKRLNVAAGKTGPGNRYQAEARLQLAETNRQADWMHIVPASRVKASPASS